MSEIDLLSIDRGLVVAPAGCGKTQLIAHALRDNRTTKPILVLTHTNSGVAALRARLNRLGVKPSDYRVMTIDGWAMRLISTFPDRSGHKPEILTAERPNYREIRKAAWQLLKANHINDVVKATYARLLVDEYQDCSLNQHSIIYCAAAILPTCVLGDPVQAIFGFGDDGLANWDEHVCVHFPAAGELTRPWRWENAGAKDYGDWLLGVRRQLLAREAIDLRSAPKAVQWVQLDGTGADYQRLLTAGRTKPPNEGESVLIIGDSRNPSSQHKFASETPGAETVEAVDLRDLVEFARNLDLARPDALKVVAEFADKVMTGVGPDDLLRRVGTLAKGRERKEASVVEKAALAFLAAPSFDRVRDLLVEFNKDFGARVVRRTVFRACLRALELCCGPEKCTFLDAAIRMREQNRHLGRSLPRRAVGSTLTLKGLEAEVVVILDVEKMNARNFYVALTRGSKRAVICGRNPVLKPEW